MLTCVRYALKAIVFFDQAGNSGIKTTIDGTATINDMKVQVDIIDTTLRVSDRITSLGDVVSHGGAGSGDHCVKFDGVVSVATAGLLRIQWGQASASLGALTAQKDSYFSLSQLAS